MAEKEKVIVVISKPHNMGTPVKGAPISLFVNDREFGARMELESFLDLLVAEVGSPAMMFRQETLRAKVMESANAIIAQMKSETRRIL